MRRKTRAADHVKPSPADPAPWYTKDKRIVLLGARGLWNGRFETEAAALRACRAALARAGLGGRHTTEAIRYRIRTESRGLDKPPSRAYWTRAEDRVIDRLAHAVARHEYHDATAAGRACLRALARHKRHFPRSLIAVSARIGARALEFGREHARVNFTPEEWRVLRELVPQVSSGRFREAKDASRMFLAIMARRRRTHADGSMVPVRTLGSVDQKLARVAKEVGLAWGFRDWSPEEDRVVDQFIDRYSKGEFRSLRSTARACRTELRRLDADRRKHPERGRPYGRSFLAVHLHLSQRAVSRGVARPLFRRWRGPEGRIAARYAGLFAADGGRHTTWDFATVLQRALRRRGYQRTLTACKAEIRRARLRMNGLL
ncbi:MAG: hypothetical protein NTX53_14230 [candidate division WOR-3 bacterium]|nr:hypothetical protein [candidate division WOR-3 bacterium]